MEVYKDLDRERAGPLIRESDEMREKYFAEMTNHEWTCANNYHLSIDTSLFRLDDIAQTIITIMKRKGLIG